MVFAVTGPWISTIDFMGGMERKHQRLAAVDAPRLIIVGGSNGAFGINSTALEQAVGRPVVNMCLHASLGYRFMLNEVRGSLREGDLVLLVLEHSQFQEPDKRANELYAALERYPPAWAFVPSEALPEVGLTYAVRKYQTAVENVVDPWVGAPEEVYLASGFDERGDLLTHLERQRTVMREAKPMRGDTLAFHPQFWSLTARFLLDAEAAGARVCFSWPCQKASSVNPMLDGYMAERLRKSGACVLGRPHDQVYPDSLFYDTRYHLAGEGRELRTQQLIKDLGAALPLR
ncbi:MAG: hypothetical protein IPJ76_14380 [Flavobacteriales bacterium]|nr:MAG: hypothetical protein IPJ76_14380 [Flavobacteriales bacterium]